MTRLAIRFTGREITAAGLFAGAVMAGFLMVAAAVVIGADRFFLPVRMTAAILLGRDALAPAYSLPVAGVIGLAIHLSLSVLFAFIFSAFVSPLWSRTSLSVAGIVYAATLWLLNLHVIAPLADWTWLSESGNPVVLLFAHTLFFGCPLGWSLAESRPLVDRRP